MEALQLRVTKAANIERKLDCEHTSLYTMGAADI